VPCWASLCYGHSSVCKKSLPDTSLCRHSSEHRRRQSSYQTILLQVSFTHRCHQSQSACTGMQTLHLPFAAHGSTCSPACRHPVRASVHLLTAVDFHPGQTWKDTDGDTIQVCMHQALFAPSMHSWLLYSCHMPCAFKDASETHPI